MTATGGADRKIGANADLSSCDTPSVTRKTSRSSGAEPTLKDGVMFSKSA
jgi:hypothetical protein